MPLRITLPHRARTFAIFSIFTDWKFHGCKFLHKSAWQRDVSHVTESLSSSAPITCKGILQWSNDVYRVCRYNAINGPFCPALPGMYFVLLDPPAARILFPINLPPGNDRTYCTLGAGDGGDGVGGEKRYPCTVYVRKRGRQRKERHFDTRFWVSFSIRLLKVCEIWRDLFPGYPV